MSILLVTIDPGNKKKTNLLTKQLKFGYHLQGQAWPYFLDCPRIWGDVIYAFGKWGIAWSQRMVKLESNLVFRM